MIRLEFFFKLLFYYIASLKKIQGNPFEPKRILVVSQEIIRRTDIAIFYYSNFD